MCFCEIEFNTCFASDCAKASVLSSILSTVSEGFHIDINEGILNLTITNDRASNDTTFSFSHFQHCCKFLLWQQLVKITTLLPKAFFAALDAWLVPQRSSKGHPSERCKGPTYVSPPFGNTRIYLASNHIFKVAASTKLLPDTYLIHLVSEFNQKPPPLAGKMRGVCIKDLIVQH